ncbi:putative DNA modification/repair radical SAM protein [Tunturiibacter gelidiferens]|uniref:putative DNA modification/repair radical SAM protein n=1 Tax=Tunturiibacter gelidiferens TaxID=3069689 RepID=UPI003D9BD13B
MPTLPAFDVEPLKSNPSPENLFRLLFAKIRHRITQRFDLVLNEHPAKTRDPRRRRKVRRLLRQQRSQTERQRPGHRPLRRHGHLPLVHPRWPLRLSLKILLTNFCTYDCVFCVNRISSDIQRARFTPEEVITLTLDFYKRNYIEGLFLSSGIIQSPDYTMEQLIQVAKTLRLTHHFGGYIHLKAIPGASQLLIEQAGLYADRLSANIELPTQQDLIQLAPEKLHHHRIHHEPDRHAQRRGRRRPPQIPQAPKFASAGQSTQMVIGATPATDREILTTATHLYGHYKLRRIYYTGFSPYPAADARLPLKPAPMMREHRLYQSDWLMRFYGFNAAELTSEESPSLSLTEDPKTTWAKLHPEFFPVDVNAAPANPSSAFPASVTAT